MTTATFAQDGVTWETSPVSPYNNTIVFQNGGVHECGKRARPMLLVEDGQLRSTRRTPCQLGCGLFDFVTFAARTPCGVHVWQR